MLGTLMKEKRRVAVTSKSDVFLLDQEGVGGYFTLFDRLYNSEMGIALLAVDR